MGSARVTYYNLALSSARADEGGVAPNSVTGWEASVPKIHKITTLS